MQGLLTPGEGLAFSVEAATPLVRAAVKRKRGMFAHFPDLGLDDLEQLVLIEVRKSPAQP
jgi:hypothetical protein